MSMVPQNDDRQPPQRRGKQQQQHLKISSDNNRTQFCLSPSNNRETSTVVVGIDGESDDYSTTLLPSTTNCPSNVGGLLGGCNTAGVVTRHATTPTIINLSVRPCDQPFLHHQKDVVVVDSLLKKQQQKKCKTTSYNNHSTSVARFNCNKHKHNHHHHHHQQSVGLLYVCKSDLFENLTVSSHGLVSTASSGVPTSNSVLNEFLPSCGDSSNQHSNRDSSHNNNNNESLTHREHNNRDLLLCSNNRESLYAVNSVERDHMMDRGADSSHSQYLDLPGSARANCFRPTGRQLAGLPREQSMASCKMNGYIAPRDDLVALGTLAISTTMDREQLVESSQTPHRLKTKKSQSAPNAYPWWGSSTSSTGLPQTKFNSSIPGNTATLPTNTKASSRHSNHHHQHHQGNKSQSQTYHDPIVGAPGFFTQRLADLAQMEQETLKYERSRKNGTTKRKSKSDS